MSIRFCEFCSSVHQEGTIHCPVCGTPLTQAVTEEQFNDPAKPWPFRPVDTLLLRIQGRPYEIRFSGTHSVYHLWSLLHGEFDAMRLCCKPRQEELELVSFPPEHRPAEYRLVDPGVLLNCRHRKFSFHTCQEADPAVAAEPGELEMEYQGSFEIAGCPQKLWGNVLGWLAGTQPRPAHDWTYDI